MNLIKLRRLRKISGTGTSIGMDALAMLALQIDWGADEALADQPVNRLAARPMTGAPDRPSHAPLPPPGAPRSAAAAPLAVPFDAPTVMAANTLDEWRAAVRQFTGCALRETATHPVLAAGDPAAGLLLIGDPPGAEDDRSGQPFSGPAGVILDRILAALGMERDKLLLAPLIPWRPPGNRPPTDAELALCLPLLHRLIALTAPRRVVLSGILPVRALLGSGASLRRIRGRWTDLRVPGLERPVPALPSHSLANLKNAAERRELWEHWRMLHREISAGST